MEFWPLKTLSEVSGVLLGLQLSPTPNMGVHLGVWGFTPSHCLHSLHSREHVMWLSGLLLGPQPLNLLALVASQMLGLRHNTCASSWGSRTTLGSCPQVPLLQENALVLEPLLQHKNLCDFSCVAFLEQYWIFEKIQQCKLPYKQHCYTK
jgi:hypothetical protein